MGTLYAITFITAQILAVFKGQPFAPRAFGIGAGAMLAAYGACWHLKSDRLPKEGEQQ
jgi:hypothetical protein